MKKAVIIFVIIIKAALCGKTQFYLGPLVGYEKSAIHPVVNWDQDRTGLYIDDRSWYNSASYFYGLQFGRKIGKHFDLGIFSTYTSHSVFANSRTFVPLFYIHYKAIRSGMMFRFFPIPNLSLGVGPTYRHYLLHQYEYQAYFSDLPAMSSWGTAFALGLHVHNFSLEYQYHAEGKMNYGDDAHGIINYKGFRHGNVGLSYRIKL